MFKPLLKMPDMHRPKTKCARKAGKVMVVWYVMLLNSNTFGSGCVGTRYISFAPQIHTHHILYNHYRRQISEGRDRLSRPYTRQIFRLTSYFSTRRELFHDDNDHFLQTIGALRHSGERGRDGLLGSG